MVAQVTGDIVINEVAISPDSGGFDANNSGTTNASDEYVEIYNTGVSAVDISGWELWEGGPNPGGANNLVIHTFPGAQGSGTTMLGAGDYFTVVDGSGGGDLSNITGGQSAFTNADSWFIGEGSTVALYNATNNEFVIVAGNLVPDITISGASSNAVEYLIDEIVAAHPGASLVGVEQLTAEATNESSQRSTDGGDDWISDPATAGAANTCFAAGTMITTPEGMKAVEALQVGDLVTTADGRAVPVIWVGHQTIAKQFARDRARLVRIAEGALGDGPNADLYVTADHGMVFGDMVVNASALVNGGSIDAVPLSETAEHFTVYHVETAAHNVIFANGAASETYLDIPGRQLFDNHQEYVDLYGEGTQIAEAPMPRITSQRLLPLALRQRIGLDDAAQSA